jgi:hypothetical protein
MALHIQDGDNLGHYPILPSVPADVRFDAWVADESEAAIEGLDISSGPPLPSL